MNREKMLRSLILAIAFFVFSGCTDLFEFSPNQVFDDDTPVSVNQKNLDSLFSRPVDDTIKLIFIGDSQRFYDELEAFISKANSIYDLDMVLLAGDISDFGLLEEFEQIEEFLKDLHAPYIGVVGNHDVQARGAETFERMFGPLNFSFIYDDVKFIFHNTNSREYSAGTVPDMKWLSNQFADPKAKYFIPVSHIPPFDMDFDQDLETSYRNLLQKNKTLISLHGHTHQFKDGFPYEDGIRYMTSHSFELKSFVLMKIVDGKVYHEIIEY